MHRRFFTMAALALLMIGSAGWAEGPSLANSDFEQGIAGWSGAGKYAISKDEKHGGGQSLSIDRGHVYSSINKAGVIMVEPGKDYTISLWIKCDGADEKGATVMVMRRGGPAEGDLSKVFGWAEGLEPAFVHDDGQSPAVIATGGTHDWKKFSFVIPSTQITEQVRGLHLYLRHDANKAPAGKVYFDDLTVESGAGGKVAPKVILLNGGFEKGKANWWGPGFDKKTASVVTDNPAEGKSCLKLDSGWLCQDKRPVVGGQKYRISMKVRSVDTAEDSIYVQASFRGSGVDAGWYGPAKVAFGDRQEPALFTTGGAHDWKTLSVVMEAPAGADQILIYLRKKDATGTAYFDDIRIEPTDEAAMTAADLARQELVAGLLLPARPDAEASASLSRIVNAKEAAPLAQLSLADKGVAKYAIHVGTDSDLVTLHAAHELATYLTKVTGGTFSPIAHDKHPLNQPLIIVGRDNALAAKLCPDIPYDTLGHDGFVIRTVGAHLLIAGATPRGTMYGVNWLLDHHIGIKWLAPDYTLIPSQSTITLAAINQQFKPRFEYREIFSSESHDDVFAAHNLLNGRSHGRSFSPSNPRIDAWESWWVAKGGDRNFFDLLPQSKFAKQHPEWYAGGQIAMMNPDVRREIAASAIAELKKLKDYRSVRFNIHDMDWGWDMDAESRAFAAQHGGSAAAPRLDMMIDVAQQVRKVLPEAKFSFNAYHWSFTPPTGMTVPEYLLVFPMTIHVDYAAPLNKGPNLQLGRDIENWAKISKRVLVWDHTINFFGYIQPTPNLYQICESVQWLSTLQPVMGYFAEDSWQTRGAEFAPLRTWVLARLLWDPSLPYKQVVKEYCDAYYGAASPYVLEYIDLMHQSLARTGDTFREKTTPMSAYLNLDFLSRADQLYTSAEAVAADQPETLKHVRIARLAVDYSILILRHELALSAHERNIAWDPDTQNRLARFYKNYELSGMKYYRQSAGIAELKEIFAIERHQPTVPDMVRNKPAGDWVDYQDLCFTRYATGERNMLVADSAASDGAAIRIAGKSPVWTVQFRRYKLPKEGLWNLYTAVRADCGTGTATDDAIRVGSSPPMGRYNTATIGELEDGQYHLVPVAGGPFKYEQDDEKIVYFQAPNTDKVKYIYIDRIIAVRHAPEK